MTRPTVLARAAVVAAMLAGCRELPAPEGGVQALSGIVLPSPGLVVGDTMRDSLGVATPLRVVAFDENGDTISPAPAAVFVVFDTTARLEGEFLVGRSTGRARLIATVAGLTSRLDTVTVTLEPDTIVRADSTRHVRRVNVLSGDTTFASADLNVIVQNRAGATAAAVPAVIVKYTLTRAPSGAPGGSGPTVVFVGGSAAQARDTTNADGRAARSIRLRLAAQPQLTDSAIVAATASYRGQTLGTVQFTIVFQTQTQ